MTRRTSTLLAGSLLAAAFVVALTIRILPEIDLVGAGSRAPGFKATNLGSGASSGLVDYRNRVILLNIWATWCQPCRIEMPAMQRLARRMEGTDFRIVAVSVDKDGPDPVRAFAKDLGLSFDILHDPSGEIQHVYQTTGVPESFLIDRHGVIVKKVIGATAWDSPVNELLVRRLLDER